jgi:hypothetical protein
MPDGDEQHSDGDDLSTGLPGLPYSLANFRLLLAEGAQPTSRYTHAEIAAWAGGFWWRYTIWPAEHDISVPPHLETAADLAQEIEFDFDSYVADRYSLPDQRHVHVSQFRLPEERFVHWLNRLNELVPPTVSE